MNLHSSTTRKPTVLSKRISLAGLGAVAAVAALILSPDSAHAGAAELKALTKALTEANTTPATATPAQLAAAVKAVIAGNPKLKPGVVAGEALKTPASGTFGAGDEIAAALIEAVGGSPDSTTRAKLVGDAAKTATTSKNATPQQVPSFSKSILNNQTEAFAAAEFARASKNAVGAILGGFASTLAPGQQAVLADTALHNTKLAGAATEIARFVGSTVAFDQTDEFALALSVGSPKLLTKIAPGVAAAAPENAGEITRQILNTTSTDLKTSFQKGSALYAKVVSAVADIEQISVIGAVISDVIGNNVAGPNGKPLVSLNSAVALTKTLAKAIISKPTVNLVNSTSGTNKGDEIAEVAAYVVGGIIGNTGLTSNAKVTSKLIVSIVKAAVTGGKATKKQVPAAANYIADIAGSVALTIAQAKQNNLLDGTIADAIQAELVKQAKAIGGKANSAAVSAALALGASNSAEALAKLENGFDLGALVDPETDNKTF
ncbi:hypothetical protein ACXR0O_06325 [Verrucomicrobiota bacterium sgz303538]